MIPNGGIGQFAKSFVEMMSSHGIKVDILTDKKPPNNEFIDKIREAGANIMYPKISLPYTEHSAIFMYGDSYCYERMTNFRNVVIQALEHNLYDAFVCNTYETVQVVHSLGLNDCIQTIAYTHLESQIFKDTKNPFLHSVNSMMRKQLEVPGLTIGTQSIFNKVQFDNAVHLPIPLPEKGLLKEYDVPREGVLFIGRWEEGKNPELFLDLIDQTKLPARVMTSANGARKFEDRLSKIGVDYIVKDSIIGQEKIDFIVGCRVAFNPSTVESYGLAFLEQMIQLPTVALDNQRWTKNFDSNRFSVCTKKNMALEVATLYDQYPTASSWYANKSIQFFRALEDDVFHKWNECIIGFERVKSSSNTAKICAQTTTKYSDFIKSLGRKIICIDDVRSVLTNQHKYRTIYTDDSTYLSKDPSFEPVEDEIGLALFKGI